MNVAQVTAEIMKREGTDYLLAYPLNPLTESCAAAGIRPIIVRQERIGIHMADAISRLSSGDRVGVFCQQAGPGVENSFGAVAQAWSECVPLVVIPAGSSRATSMGETRLQRHAQLPAHHQVRGDDHHAGTAGAGAAPRLYPGPQRASGPDA